jgi:hypothetical protein
MPNPNFLRNLERYITVLGTIQLALAKEIEGETLAFDPERFIRFALQYGRHAQVTREEILEAWDESPATIVRRGFGIKKPLLLKPSTQKQANARGWYYAIVWKVNEDLTRTRVYKSEGTFSSREAALERAKEVAKILLGVVAPGDPIP